MSEPDDGDAIRTDIVQLARLSLAASEEDIRLYVARLVRKYRAINPDLSLSLNQLLKKSPENQRSILREDQETNDLSSITMKRGEGFFFQPQPDEVLQKPILSEPLERQLQQVIREYQSAEKLRLAGLEPSSTLVFVGLPGIGKTLSARWLANQLNLPVYILDLAAIMGSYLGQTGANLKNALAFAKEKPCVLLLDEIDALVKKRNDDSDIGEVKRIVTVMLQEIDLWPSRSILIAATNHPELVDPALWRRFDHILEFDPPTKELTRKAIISFLGDSYDTFANYLDILELLLEGLTFSDIERQITRIRRLMIIEGTDPWGAIIGSLGRDIATKKNRVEIAKLLMKNRDISQHKISELTGVSRDTLRKFKP